MRAIFKHLLLASLIGALVGCTKKIDGIPATPVIVSLDTTRVRTGDKITITGDQFAATAAGNNVSIGGITVPILEASTTRLVIAIPIQSRSGLLSVSVNGKSATFPSAIQVIVFGQPVISSLSSNTVSIDDTLFIKGQNFGNTFDSVGVTIAGKSALILNTSDTAVKCIVPVLSGSGNVIVSYGQLFSNAVPLKLREDIRTPLLDGRIYFLRANIINGSSIAPVQVGKLAVYRCTVDRSSNGAQLLFDFSTVVDPAIDPATGLVLTCGTSDDFYVLGNKRPTTTDKIVSKLTFSGFNVSYSYLPAANYPMIGGVVSADDQIVYAGNAQSNTISRFLRSRSARSKNFLFTATDAPTITYKNINTNATYSISGITGVSNIFLSASPEHQDSLLIYSRSTAGTSIKGRFYMFDAATGVLKLLYGEANWADSPGGVRTQQGEAQGKQFYVDYNVGFLWAGSHIFYANGRRDFNSTQLYQLNVDGTTKTPVLIYDRLEAANTQKAAFFSLVIRKSETAR